MGINLKEINNLIKTNLDSVVKNELNNLIRKQVVSLELNAISKIINVICGGGRI